MDSYKVAANASAKPGFPDFLDGEGAAVLKNRIEAFWSARGLSVDITLQTAPFSPAARRARVDVRSNMINGLPRTSPLRT